MARSRDEVSLEALRLGKLHSVLAIDQRQGVHLQHAHWYVAACVCGCGTIIRPRLHIEDMMVESASLPGHTHAPVHINKEGGGMNIGCGLSSKLEEAPQFQVHKQDVHRHCLLVIDHVQCLRWQGY